ncbi:MAG: HEAT repeat domain-containing protein [Pseudanabaenaceae cyanobacterium]
MPTFEELKALMQDADGGVRVRAAVASRALSPAEQFAIACLGVQDDNARVRYDAASRLGTVGHCDLPQTQALLQKLLREDPETDVRAAAADAIAALKLTAAYDDLMTAYDSAMGSEGWLLRFSIVAALGELGDRRARDFLWQVLTTESGLLPLAALGALGDLGDREALPQVLPLADHEDWQIRHRLVQVVVALGGDRPTLERLSHDPVPEVAAAATQALTHS